MNERRTFWEWLMDWLLRLGIVKPDRSGCRWEGCGEDADRFGWCWDHFPDQDDEEQEEPVR